MAQAVVFLTTTGGVLEWAPPADFPGIADKVGCIGGGQGGHNAGGNGGSGADYAEIDNLAIAGSVPYSIGVGGTVNGGHGGDTFFNGAAISGASVGAKGGGSSSSSVGSTIHPGGSPGSGSFNVGGGGSGAGGPSGAGVNSTGTSGSSGDAGFGGSGGGSGNPAGVGGAGAEWTATIGGTAGSGGGGGGGSNGHPGAAGGLYGGGGGGGGTGSTGGAGQPGIIAIFYTPLQGGGGKRKKKPKKKKAKPTTFLPVGRKGSLPAAYVPAPAAEVAAEPAPAEAPAPAAEPIVIETKAPSPAADDGSSERFLAKVFGQTPVALARAAPDGPERSAPAAAAAAPTRARAPAPRKPRPKPKPAPAPIDESDDEEALTHLLAAHDEDIRQLLSALVGKIAEHLPIERELKDSGLTVDEAITLKRLLKDKSLKSLLERPSSALREFKKTFR